MVVNEKTWHTRTVSGRSGRPWEILYADDLVIIAENLKGLCNKLTTWKHNLEAKGLRVNMGKTKIMMSGPDLNNLKDSWKIPCVGLELVGSNIFCTGCNHWVHKRCSGLCGRLVADINFRCKICTGQTRPVDVRPFEHVELGDHKLEVVDSFRYLGDVLGADGGCVTSAIVRSFSSWGKFRELLPILTCRSLSWRTRWKVFSACVRSVLLYGTENWNMRTTHTNKLERTDRAMLRWICGIRLSEQVCTEALYRRLYIPPLDSLLRTRHLRWYGHVCRNDSLGQTRTPKEDLVPNWRHECSVNS